MAAQFKRDERLFAAIGEMVNGAREEFLAGAAFAEEQHRGFGRRDTLQLMADRFHRVGFADDAREAVTRGKFLAQDEIFAQQFLLACGAFDEQFQMIEINGLLDKIECAFLHGGNGFFDRTECGEQNDGDRGISLLGFAQHVEAGRAGHFQIGDHHLVALGADFLNGRGTIRSFFHAKAIALQRLA